MRGAAQPHTRATSSRFYFFQFSPHVHTDNCFSLCTSRPVCVSVILLLVVDQRTLFTVRMLSPVLYIAWAILGMDLHL